MRDLNRIHFREINTVVDFLAERLRYYTASDLPISLDLTEEIIVRVITYLHIKNNRGEENSGKYHLSVINGGGFSLDNPLVDSLAREIIAEFFLQPNQLSFVQQDFSVVLGQIHECLLERYDQRKKEGTYYTPVYVVKEMVGRTLDAYLASQTEALSRVVETTDICATKNILRQVQKYRVLDPACGSGAFLIEIFRSFAGFYHTATELVKRQIAFSGSCDDILGIDTGNLALYILNNHVRGIDIDPDAVRLTGLALYFHGLKLCSGDFGGLADGIKKVLFTGNSLIDDVIDFGSIDLVIGNPPYISNKSISKATKEAVKTRYRLAEGQYDTVVPFIECGLNFLKSGGTLCFIVSNKFMAADYGTALRRYLLDETEVRELIDLSMQKIFSGAAAYPVIINICKQKPGRYGVKIIRGVVDRLKKQIEFTRGFSIAQTVFKTLGQAVITTQLNDKTLPIVEKINFWPGRIPVRKIFCGMASTGFNRVITEKPKYDEDCLPVLLAGDIGKFSLADVAKFVPVSYLNKNQQRLFRKDKIVIPGMTRCLKAAVDMSGRALGRVYFIPSDETTESESNLFFLLALFNSAVLEFYYRTLYWPVHLSDGYLRVNSTYLSALPIPCWDGERVELNSQVRAIIKYAEQISNRDFPDETRLNLNAKLEAMVFELYGLSRSEACLVMDFLRMDKNIYNMVRNFMNDV